MIIPLRKPLSDRNFHQAPSVIGKRQAPRRKLQNPNSQQTFIATMAEKIPAMMVPEEPAT